MHTLPTMAMLSLKNVLRHARKSRASLAIMTCAVLALNVLAGYIEGSLSVLEDAFVRWGARGHLIVERPASELAKTVEGVAQVPLDEREQRAIGQVLGADAEVIGVARMLRLSGMLDAGRVSTVFAGVGWDAQAVRAIKGPAYEHDVIAGESLWQSRRPDALVLGQGLAKVIGCEVPSAGFAPLRPGAAPPSRTFTCPPGPVQLTVATLADARVGAERFTPVGIMDWGIKEINDRLAVMDLAQAQRLLNTRSVSEMHVLLRDAAAVPAAQRRIAAALDQAVPGLLVSKWSDRASFYHQVEGMMLAFLAFALTVALIVSYMSLLNSSYLNFMQRTKELATLRSLGYSSRFVLGMAALENAWLALLAGGIGVAGAAAIARAVGASGLSWTPPGSTNAVPIEIAVLPAVYVLSALVVVALAAVASAIPTRRILARSIVESLSST